MESIYNDNQTYWDDSFVSLREKCYFEQFERIQVRNEVTLQLNKVISKSNNDALKSEILLLFMQTTGKSILPPRSSTLHRKNALHPNFQKGLKIFFRYHAAFTPCQCFFETAMQPSGRLTEYLFFLSNQRMNAKIGITSRINFKHADKHDTYCAWVRKGFQIKKYFCTLGASNQNEDSTSRMSVDFIIQQSTGKLFGLHTMFTRVPDINIKCLEALYKWRCQNITCITYFSAAGINLREIQLHSAYMHHLTQSLILKLRLGFFFEARKVKDCIGSYLLSANFESLGLKLAGSVDITRDGGALHFLARKKFSGIVAGFGISRKSDTRFGIQISNLSQNPH